MAVSIKTPEQIDKMRAACRIVGECLNMLEGEIRVGITTLELDKIAADFIKSRGGIPTFLNYNGYPGNICISVNEEVIHGIPGLRRLKTGDIVSMDVGVTLNGFIGDAARTFTVGTVKDELLKLIEVTRQSFFEGIKHAHAGSHLYQISAAIGAYAESFGYGVVKEFTGHGVGRQLHEAPEIPNFRQPSRGIRLQPGMTLAIEPMVNLGTANIWILPDEWTVITRDKKPSAHYENTILITDGEPEIMTLV